MQCAKAHFFQNRTPVQCLHLPSPYNLRPKAKFSLFSFIVAHILKLSAGTEKQGVKKGINKGKTEIILEMLKEKQPLDFIARVSKYSKEKISEIGRLNGIL